MAATRETESPLSGLSVCSCGLCRVHRPQRSKCDGILASGSGLCADPRCGRVSAESCVGSGADSVGGGCARGRATWISWWRGWWLVRPSRVPAPGPALVRCGLRAETLWCRASAGRWPLRRPARGAAARHLRPAAAPVRLRAPCLRVPVWPKAHPAISRGVCTAQCGFFIYIDVGHEAPPCRALRAPAGRGKLDETADGKARVRGRSPESYA